jgi:hypothetical protein
LVKRISPLVALIFIARAEEDLAGWEIATSLGESIAIPIFGASSSRKNRGNAD